MTSIHIEHAAPEDAFALSLQIPEFEPWYPWTKWQQRLHGKSALVLIAMADGRAVGFKAGYYTGDHFYSWVGGVLPDFRGLGVATALAEQQEALVRASGIPVIRMKTRNRFRGMLHFALRRGFLLSGVDQRGEPLDWRITLVKNL